MLVEMIINSTECNKTVNGCTNILTRRTSACGQHELTSVETYADTSHGWWTKWAEYGDTVKVDHISEELRGVWIAAGGNFHCNIYSSENLVVRKHHAHITKDGNVLENSESMLNWEEVLSSYIVCDNIEQALEYWEGAINNTDNEFLIAGMPIVKEHEPEHDGWRWHKWGKYIGTQNPKHEYIRDEEDINEVICFNIYWVEKK